ncbi:PR-1 [Micractinium conductrix]|uniref:PR-1 n=1 Tax=Micractinium conductrix TaxID=554055 RepID=A0A2P6VBP1_9CHLO|nr:PR-1 [Micractinium conductrix]|eukprot:PSC71503.1 PR-1 [Micractinium conductrix]
MALTLLLIATPALGRNLKATVTVNSTSTSGNTTTTPTAAAGVQAAQPSLLSGFGTPAWLSNKLLSLTGTRLPATTPTITIAPTTTAPSATAPLTTPTSTLGGGCPDPQRALDAHNAARAQRGAAPLAWSADLAAGAQRWSAGCLFQHSSAPGIGENLYMSSAAGATCADAVSMWVAEAPLYTGSYNKATGHWTQIVWKGTTHVGCGLARCGSGVMVTCRYTPPGNVLGAFAQNV